jgi:hypothetical protein
MQLTVNHPDKETKILIMKWLYENAEVKGYEEHLLNEPLTNLLAPSEIAKLEEYLGRWFDESITLSNELIFVEECEECGELIEKCKCYSPCCGAPIVCGDLCSSCKEHV